MQRRSKKRRVPRETRLIFWTSTFLWITTQLGSLHPSSAMTFFFATLENLSEGCVCLVAPRFFTCMLRNASFIQNSLRNACFFFKRSKISLVLSASMTSCTTGPWPGWVQISKGYETKSTPRSSPDPWVVIFTPELRDSSKFTHFPAHCSRSHRSAR